MPDATFNFPRGFLWGTATSSHQVEGNNRNNQWWAWEQEEGRIMEGHKSGLACDWWGGRWKEDFDRAAEAGQNAHRLSIEWSRIQPKPDRWDEHALDHYREIVRGLDERGMFPLVTLHHFSDPLWLSEIGGWENEEVVAYFESYVEKVVDALKGYVTTWCTINEPNVYASLGYVLGDFPPGKHDQNAAFAVLSNMVKAHATAYYKIKEIQPEARVGFATQYRGMKPARRWMPLDRMLANMLDTAFNQFFPSATLTGKARMLTKKLDLPQAKGTMDYLGLNYYTSELVRFDLSAADQMFYRGAYPADAELSPTGFIANQPTEFFQALRWAKRMGLPVIVTENGVEDPQDDFRRRYLVEHVLQLWRAVNFTYPVKGYFQWSLVDNFEWERGWTQRFGLWELDVESQARRKRPSVDLYAAICRQNALSSDMIRQFTPELEEKILTS